MIPSELQAPSEDIFQELSSGVARVRAQLRGLKDFNRILPILKELKEIEDSEELKSRVTKTQKVKLMGYINEILRGVSGVVAEKLNEDEYVPPGTMIVINSLGGGSINGTIKGWNKGNIFNGRSTSYCKFSLHTESQ